MEPSLAVKSSRVVLHLCSILCDCVVVSLIASARLNIRDSYLPFKRELLFLLSRLEARDIHLYINGVFSLSSSLPKELLKSVILEQKSCHRPSDQLCQPCLQEVISIGLVIVGVPSEMEGEGRAIRPSLESPDAPCSCLYAVLP